jgi:transposase
VDRYASNLPISEQRTRSVEVLSGPVRRRRWSDEEKAAIVAESLAPGAAARRVALRHGVHPNQLYAWRRELALERGGAAAEFVPVAEAAAPGQAIRPRGVVEIEIADARVRVGPDVDMALLGAVLRVVRQA